MREDKRRYHLKRTMEITNFNFSHFLQGAPQRVSAFKLCTGSETPTIAQCSVETTAKLQLTLFLTT